VGAPIDHTQFTFRTRAKLCEITLRGVRKPAILYISSCKLDGEQGTRKKVIISCQEQHRAPDIAYTHVK
jgi:hypothetical protein